MNKPLIVGVGAALVDLLVEETDEFLLDLGSEKGGMTLVELPTIDLALRRSVSPVKVVPGGSACNTLVGVGNLGGRARMVGRLGRDDLAEAFNRGLEKAGVEAHISRSDSSTGRVLSVVTPDAQRTMFTYLGASAELTPEHIRDEDFTGATLVLLEGYLAFNPPVVERVIALAKKQKAKIALDLSSFEVVGACREFLDKIIADSVDILIANEDEAEAYTGLEEEPSLQVFASKVEVAIVKLGKNGVLLAQGSKRLRVQAHVVNAIDTTGAGDLWASGFLYGLMESYSLENCARLGCALGAEVVQVMGAVIPETGWKRIQHFKAALA